jgi:hypothetical protein
MIDNPFALSVACAASEVETPDPSTSALRAYAQGERKFRRRYLDILAAPEY